MKASFELDGEQHFFRDVAEFTQVSAISKPVAAVQPVAVQQPQQDTSPCEWEVTYKDGITYRALPSWDDRLPDDYPIAACGTKFTNPDEEWADGVLYIGGDSGFWLPTTTKDGTEVIRKNGGQTAGGYGGGHSSASGAAEPWAVQAAPAQPQPAAEPSLAPGWVGHSDPSSGKTYYYNASTGITQWEFPENPSAAPTVVNVPTNSGGGYGGYQQPQPVQQQDSQFEQDVSFLEGMGFGTKDQCSRMLTDCDGNVDRAVQSFLDGNQA